MAIPGKLKNLVHRYEESHNYYLIHHVQYLIRSNDFLQLMELKMSLEGLEKERDFYFGKLRDIEVMCQDCDNGDPPPIVQKILEVLYATEVRFILQRFHMTNNIRLRNCVISRCCHLFLFFFII